MSIPAKKKVSRQEFDQMVADTDERLEWIEGAVFMSPSPPARHQRISGRIHANLFSVLEGQACEVFHAPFDVELSNEEVEETQVVIPDLSVICDKDGLGEQKYVGVPSVIVEILSPSNQSHDLVTN